MKYGAKADGLTTDTKAIQDSIEAAVKNGGGTVYFPPGPYLTGPIHLKSNITLDFGNASVKFSDDFDDYLPMVKSRWEGTELINFSPLIYANGVENIVIRGHGEIDGQGKKRWDYWLKLAHEFKNTGHIPELSKWQIEFHKLNNVTELPLPDEPNTLEIGFLRPPFIQLMNSKNILIENLMIKNSPFWTINPVYSENITVRGVNVENPKPSPNTDGIDSDSCKNVLITNCTFSVDDDCIVIKSGRDKQGRRINRPSENHVITNCTTLKGWGGIVIGSEMSGGIRNISVSNLIFNGTDRGIRIKSTRGRGGVVEDIHISNITMKNIHEEAIIIDLLLRHSNPEPVSERTPTFRNIHISGISGNARRAATLRGLPESPLTNITLSNINIESESGIHTESTFAEIQDVCVHKKHKF